MNNELKIELDLLLNQVPPILREAAEERSKIDIHSTISLIREFLEADENEQAGILGFFEAEGPRIWGELDRQHQDGTPTSDNLESWLI